MSDGNPVPGIFDGMAAYRGKRGTIVLIRNHENRRQAGEIPVLVPEELSYDPTPSYNAGNTKVVLDMVGPKGDFEVLETFAILGGTDTNCAGGVTPWHSWLTCEEVVNRSSAGIKHGYVFDIPSGATGPVKAEPIVGAGRFVHEASLFHGGALYRPRTARGRRATRPARPSTGTSRTRRTARTDPLSKTTGVLQALKLRDESQANMDVGRVPLEPYPVEWVTIDSPDHEDDTDAGPIGHAEPGLREGRCGVQPRGGHVGRRQEGLLRRHERRRRRPGPGLGVRPRARDDDAHLRVPRLDRPARRRTTS